MSCNSLGNKGIGKKSIQPGGVPALKLALLSLAGPGSAVSGGRGSAGWLQPCLGEEGREELQHCRHGW